MRCLALSEEFLRRGARVEVFGTIEGVGWAERQLASRRLPLHPGPATPEELVDTARRHELDVMILDSYELDPAGAGALRAAGVVTLAIVDGDTRGQDGRPLPGPELRFPAAAPPERLLVGSAYALLRDSVVAGR
ncbi:spore coat protein, partial [Micromonospora sp. ATA32]|nr:spore coat protein [Micromonospora sp. ATA32]